VLFHFGQTISQKHQAEAVEAVQYWSAILLTVLDSILRCAPQHKRVLPTPLLACLEQLGRRLDPEKVIMGILCLFAENRLSVENGEGHVRGGVLVVVWGRESRPGRRRGTGDRSR